MRKRLLVVIACTGMLVTMMHGAVSAQPDGVVIVNDSPDLQCLYEDGNGDAGSALPPDASTRWMQMPNGDVRWMCTVEGVPNDTGMAVHRSSRTVWCSSYDFGASMPIFYTGYWHQTISPGGRMTLTCTS